METIEQVLCTDGGIYSAYFAQKLLYIGRTIKPFNIRWTSHINHIKNHDLNLNFYKYCYLNNISVDDLEFKVLFSCQQHPITYQQLRKKEVEAIQQFQPLCNERTESKFFIDLPAEPKICQWSDNPDCKKLFKELCFNNNFSAILMYLYANLENRSVYDISDTEFAQNTDISARTVARVRSKLIIPYSNH